MSTHYRQDQFAQLLLSILPTLLLLLAGSAAAAYWLIGAGALFALVPFVILLGWAVTKRKT